MRILIVDDNRGALMILQNLLTHRGHEVVMASNGREAMEVMRGEGTCRLVISDWEMPEMDGLQLCQAIRREGQAAYTYVILLTGHDTPEEKVQGLSAGADDFITKPYNPAELLARAPASRRPRPPRSRGSG